MNKIKTYLVGATLFALPVFVSATGHVGGGAPAAGFTPSGGVFGEFLRNILTFSNNVLIPFIIGIGFLVFVWGMFRYFIAGGANDEAKEQGRSLMVYATLGFVLIIVFWGIINLISSSTGYDNQTVNNIPSAFVPAP